MQVLVIIGFGILGLIIGSFLNVIILRMGTGRGIGGRSVCFSCNHVLRWYELIPLVSFLLQRGRCNHCGSKISLQYPLVETATGLLFVGVAYCFSDYFTLVSWLIASALGMIISVYDLRHKMIPVYPLIGLFIVGLFIKGSFLGLMVVALPFFILWLISQGKWIGFGDVEIIAVVGFILGVTGGFSAIMFGFWMAAAVVIPWMFIARKKYPQIRHKQIPMGPFLLMGMYLVGVLGLNIVKWLSVMV